MAKKKKNSKVIKMQPSMSLSKYIRNFGRSLEIHEVLWNEDMLDAGKGHLFVSRKKRNGDIIMGSYLLDMYCLGVKDTFYKLLPKYEYEDYIEYINESGPSPFQSVDPNYAFNIIFGAVEYAEDLGIEPHKDFSTTEYLLTPPEELEYVDIEFGLDGKPCYFYYAGDKKAEIIKKLEDAVGSEGYTYVDGEAIFDDIDGFNNNVALDDIMKFAKDRFSSEDEVDSYLFFAGIIFFLDYTYAKNIDELKHLFLTEPDALVEIIINSVTEIYPSHDKASHEHLLEGSEMLLSVAEKYLLYQNTAIVFNDIFVDAFDASGKLGIASMFASLNISMIRDEKVFALANVFAIFYYKELTTSFDPAEFRDMLDKFKTEQTDYEYPYYLVFVYLADHEEYFGRIDFDSFDWSDLENELEF